jgi:hypothetical protein
MASVEGLEKLENLVSPAFPQDQPVGPHPEALAEKVAEADPAVAVRVGGPRHQGEKVAVAGGQLGHVFEGDDPLVAWERGEQL